MLEVAMKEKLIFHARCVVTRQVANTTESHHVTAAEDSSNGVFGGWRQELLIICAKIMVDV